MLWKKRLNKNLNRDKLSKSLTANVELFKKILCDDDTLIARFVENQTNSKIKGCILFFDGMVDKEIINKNIIEPLVQNNSLKEKADTIDIIMSQVILTHKIEKATEINNLIEALYNGEAVLFFDGFKEAIIVFSKGGETRQITEPETERVLRGPREGFTESLSTNLYLIKRKLKTPDLKLKMRVLGEKSHTDICVCYIKGVANEKILNELNSRLDKIEMDGIIDSGYIEEIIKDAPYSPFKTIGNTERPDVVAAKLLEGRIAVIADGSPAVLTLPYIFIENFQANDDYYINFYFSSIGRLLRILGFLLTISVPAVYLALVTYHHDVIPAPLLLNISASRQGVPFPTIVEEIAMLLTFEILRETGLRMPNFMGQALSIVGALVIGTAAVDAKFISAAMVIVAAFTGITGLMITSMKGVVIVLRFIFIFLSAFLGLYGYIFGIAGLMIHLFELRSFGIPYMYNLMFLDPLDDIKDTAIRAPWWLQKYRPRLIADSRLRSTTSRGKKL